jgi:hypothetical protein
MRRLAVTVILFCVWASSAFADDFKLSNGDVLSGEAASFNDDGLVVRLSIGGFSQRVPWGKFTQETLKKLENNEEAKPFVEPYIEVPLEIKEKAKAKKKAIVVKEPPTVPLVEAKGSFFASLGNPVGYFILGALYLANLFAGVEIARWKGRPVPLVAGVSAILPIFGPILFALLPSTHAAPAPPEEAAPGPEASAPVVNPMAQPGAAQSGLGLASTGASTAAGSNPVYNQVYNRSNTTFDRRFFETKFTGFFRVVPAEPEKSLMIVAKTQKAEYRAVRISRISATEVHFQVQAGTEVSVPFADVVEVSVKPKAAK